MNENVANTSSEVLDDEKPSSIKEGFQRWLIVAGLLFTLLFIFLFFKMSGDKENKQVVVQEHVPEQVQEGANKNDIDAVEAFKKNIQNKRVLNSTGESNKSPLNKDTTTIRDTELAPRLKTVDSGDSAESEQKYNRDKFSRNKLSDRANDESPYQKFMKEEQLRAYKSITSKDTIGKGSAFYANKESDQKSNSRSKKQSGPNLMETKQQVEKQIQAIQKYREGIEKGEIDPAQTPPADVMGDPKLLGGFKPRGG